MPLSTKHSERSDPLKYIAGLDLELHSHSVSSTSLTHLKEKRGLNRTPSHSNETFVRVKATIQATWPPALNSHQVEGMANSMSLTI